jgi:hypothetical protein
MANYAYVENNTVESVYDALPQNWNNISNLNLIDDENFLKTLGWYKITKVFDFDSNLFRIYKIFHEFENDTVYEKYQVVEKEKAFTEEQLAEMKWTEVRNERDQKMRDSDWRYVRYEREERLNLIPTDNLYAMDVYMQELADITNQEDPFNIVWPEYDQTLVKPEPEIVEEPQVDTE